VEKTEPDVAKQIMSPLLRVGLNLSRANRLARRCVRAPWCFLAQWYNRLEFVAPCYYVQAVLNERSTIVDCGTGLDANFSQALMARFGVRAIGVDPTRKHRSALTALEHRSNGRFTFIPSALTGVGGNVAFFQSEDNESGSLFQNHINVQRDRTTSYEVDAVTLDHLLGRAGAVDLLKLDIEGAEYAVLEGSSDDLLRRVPQIIVEFHHDIIEGCLRSDTLKLSHRLRRLGFRVHTRDLVNYLFYQGQPHAALECTKS